jgi:hypothetical protein
MLKDYVSALAKRADDFGKGFDYGIDRAVDITLQNTPKTQIPEDVYYQRTFCAGEVISEICAGMVCFALFDATTLGILPLHNHYKNKAKEQTS